MIQRSLYQNTIVALYGKPLIKILTGQRRVGKSTLLKSIIQHHTEEKTIFIDKEQKVYDHLFDSDSLYAYLISKISKNIDLTVIDEIQVITNRETAILSIYNEYPRIEIWITGSNSNMLSSELATRLR